MAALIDLMKKYNLCMADVASARYYLNQNSVLLEKTTVYRGPGDITAFYKHLLDGRANATFHFLGDDWHVTAENGHFSVAEFGRIWKSEVRRS